jgi:hypothetical protein
VVLPGESNAVICRWSRGAKCEGSAVLTLLGIHFVRKTNLLRMRFSVQPCRGKDCVFPFLN